ncbi:SH3 domain-containing protein [Phlyctema vagabunda]|uniref:SH3 domain-containing protein n=1 Tax=Phlyctema vagabunda TaxID=108571 RepID=A0ABR4P8U9_9HELO
MPSPPFKVKAVYEYTSPHDDDLHFPNGQIITVTEEEDEDWYAGEYVDASGVKQEGIFPRNFVEKYEPTAPPRPIRTTRPKKDAEPAAPALAPESVPTAPEPLPKEEPAHVQEEEPEEIEKSSVTREPPPPTPKAEVPSAQPVPKPEPVPAVAPAAAPKPIPVASKPAPPPVSDKPSGNSFRDRIAAFNKAAPPPAPFKPGGLGSGGTSFIKKPFVAPPPSKNAYVPPPREQVPAKIYRRDEDPEIAAKETEDRELAERAGFSPTNEENSEDQPKPTSLKERIALLQKQQMEQANRHADAAQKKEKPKRPAKKRVESHSPEEGDDGELADLERKDTGGTSGKKSMDSVREEVPIRATPRRKSSSRPSGNAPAAPRKSLGDGNDPELSETYETTEEPEEIPAARDDSDDRHRTKPPPPARAPTHEPDVGEEEGAVEDEEPEAGEEEEEEDSEDVDPEVRRKEELRARMAKMSGGMGMHGMFGGGMPMPMAASAPPKKKKASVSSEKKSGEYSRDDASPTTRAPPVPMIPLPGLSQVRSPEEANKKIGDDHVDAPVSSMRPADEVPDVEDVVPDRSAPPPAPPQDPAGAPPIPAGRPAPPPVPKESRPVPQAPMSPSAGSESDDEMSVREQRSTVATPAMEHAPPPPPPPAASRPDVPGTPMSPLSKRTSFFGAEPSSPLDPAASGFNRRASRVPPIPGAPAVSSPQNRAPPPPPPGLLSRTSTGDQRPPVPTRAAGPEESEGEVTEYEGDYDTDIAAAEPHKDALKSSEDVDDGTAIKSPIQSPAFAPPPLPPTAAPRAVPPSLPPQPPPNRASVDMPRAAPPPPPPAKEPAYEEDDDEYDPYRYTAPKITAPAATVPTPKVERDEDDLYSASPPRSHTLPPQDRPAPPPPPREAPPASKPPPRKSMDMSRLGSSRRSVELSRMSMDSGFVANDIDLAQGSSWWTQANGVPPALQNRKDLLFESEQTTTKRSGTSIITKDVYVLFQDYSQTILTAKYDPQNPSDVTLEQRHEQPPSRLRQDQLEQAHEQFGRKVYEAVTSKQNTIVGDGSPQGLIQELLKPFSDALLPVGTRAYGALVYGNLANASTQQNDEIRPGDIITLRNTKFQGKHGPMHAKYSAEVGKPDHVGVVAEWDGTKKKVRAWEQGRESKKVKLESFKLDDLRSGEVKIWRIMPRSWVGWEGQN